MKLRTLIAAAAAAPVLLFAGCAATTDVRSPVGDDKVVYHINDTEAQAVNALRNINNHLEVNPKVKVTVVTHARGVDFLMNDAKDRNGNPYAVSVELLKARGVTFDVCELTLRGRKLTKSQFIPEASFVPSGVGEITRLQQREGFAYVRP
jgi:intracellular sulfur oxidation DsrE/DsrF family protein